MSYDDYLNWRDDAASLEPALSVIVPAYNEAGRIVPTIAAISAHLSELGLDFEIILSDDGSTDGTAGIVRSLGLRNLIVLDPGMNRGKGAAVRDGVRAANGQLILFTDADLSTPIEEISSLLEAVESGADVVIGSRAAAGATEDGKSQLRRALSWASRGFTRFLLGVDVADTQCGFKLFTREAAHVLFAAQRIDGFSFDAELLYLAHRLGYRIDEVPVRWIDAPGSTVVPVRAAVSFVYDLVRVRINSGVGRYSSTRPAPDTNLLEPGMRLAVVTALPPSDATLTEYGHHLVHRLAAKPEIGDLLVFAEDSCGVPPAVEGSTMVPAWTFGSVCNPLRVLAAARRHRPDAVILNMHFTSFGSRKVPAALGLCTPALLRLFGFRTVVLLHNIVDTVDLGAAGFGRGRMVDKILLRVGRVLTRAVLLAHRVVTTMPTYVDVLRDRYGATNVYLTPHGSFEQPESPHTATIDGRRRILTFGKFGTYKKVDELIAAFRALQAESEGYDDVELVIAGTDSPNAVGYLAGVAEANRDLANVRFTGYVAEEDVAELFLQASIVVFPYTATTGSSGPLHQAGTYARAVIAPEIGDFVDLIDEEGFVAATFEPGDVGSLAGVMARLLDRPDERASIGRANHAAAVGLPLADITDWHLAHVEELLAA